jgi:aspartate aminotransferase
MITLSDKVKNIKASPTLLITQKAQEMKKAGIDIINLAAGEPDFDTPNNIKLAAMSAIIDGHTKYTAVSGMLELKKAIIKKLQKENNLEYNIDEVMVSVGAKQAIFNALFASINPGDEVLILAPYWVSYPEMVSMTDGVPIIVKPAEATSLKVTAEDIKKHITSKTKWLIINSPSNPSGLSYNHSDLTAIAELLKLHPNISILSDDIYEHVNFDNNIFYNIAQIDPELKNRTLIINGVSKSYSMTGWRIGYAAGPSELIKAMTNIQSQSTSSPCTISQYATLSALEGDQSYIKFSNDAFQKRRDLVLELLNNIDGIISEKPNGSFYIFPDCRSFFNKKTINGELIKNSNDLVTYLLEEAKVAVIPGEAFGMDGFFRISYATSENILVEACKRIKNALHKLS